MSLTTLHGNTIFGLFLSGLLVLNYREKSFDKFEQRERIWNSLEYGIVAALAILSVAILDSIIDFISRRSVPERMLPLLVPRVFVLIGIFSSTVYIFHEKERRGHVSDFWRLQSFQSFCLVHGCFTIACNIFERRSLTYVSIAVQTTLCIADILLWESNMTLNFSSYYGLFSLLFMMASVILFLAYIFMFINLIRHRIYSNSSVVSKGECVLSAVSVTIASIVFTIRTILSCSCIGEGPAPVTRKILMIQIYTISILSVFLSMAHSRISRCPECKSFEVGSINTLFDFLILIRAERESTQGELMSMKGSFIRYISHELRSPLNTIALGLYLQSKNKTGKGGRNSIGSLSDSVSEYDQASTLLDMVIACDHSVSVLNNLAIYEMLERGVCLITREIRVYDCVRDLISCNRDKAEARDKSVVEPDIKEDVQEICVSADSHRLQQVLQNVFNVVINLTPKSKTIVFNQSRVMEKFSSSHNRHVSRRSTHSVPRRYSHDQPLASRMKTPMTKYLATLITRARTVPDPLGYVRVTISIQQYIPPEVIKIKMKISRVGQLTCISPVVLLR